MSSDGTKVEDFFNGIASTYRQKYSGEDKFLHYFFTERLHESTRGFDFKGKRILDVGAGTGSLYDHLIAIEPEIDYYASDVSAGMLEQSAIPAERRYLGKIYEVDLPKTTFDYVFMLGVTTYMNSEELSKTFATIIRSLTPSGRAIVTFTNGRSADWKARNIFRKTIGRFLPKRFVISQEFDVFPMRLNDAQNMYSNKLTIEDIRWLNHTVFPFNQISKRLSVLLAQKIHGLSGQKLKNILSSDFLIIFRKQDGL